MRWLRRSEPTWDLGPQELEIEAELRDAAHAAPPSRQAFHARARVLSAAADPDVAAAGIGLLGATAVILALVMVFGAGGLYLGSLSLPPGTSPLPSDEPLRTDEASAPDPLPTPTDTDASRPPSADSTADTSPDDGSTTPAMTATPSPSPSPTPESDDGPPPGVSPGGPPSPMPGPPGSTP